MTGGTLSTAFQVVLDSTEKLWAEQTSERAVFKKGGHPN
jgi:hypothetical protein